jgi:replicative DNA helicase
MSETVIKKPKKSRKTNPSAPVDLSILEKAPPHDLDAERAVLGALLRNPDLCDDVVPVLRDADDFYHDAHSRIFSHMMKMRSDSSKIDLLLLVNNLKSTDELELVGGRAFIAELMEAVPVSVHAIHYARIVKDKATLRKLINAGSEIVRDAYDPQTPVKDLLNKAASDMSLLCETQSVSQVTDMEALMLEAADYLANRVKGVVDGVKTGFTKLDNMTGGFHSGELIILAARPGEGKTALALNIAENVAIASNQTVLFVSLEMEKVELAVRLICSRAQLEGNRIRNEAQFLTKEEKNSFRDVCDELQKAPMHIDDTPSRTVMEIAAVARRLKRQHDLQLLVIDYIGLITPENPLEPRQEQVAKIARHLKLLSRELKIPILCLAQLNRQADTGRKDEGPRLSQLRESGAIEQDADVVLFIHRREANMAQQQHAETEGGSYDQEQPDNMVGLIIAKQRNGPTGTVALVFDREYSRFRNPAKPHEMAAAQDLGGYAEEF